MNWKRRECNASGEMIGGNTQSGGQMSCGGVEGLIKRGAGENWTRADMDSHCQGISNPIDSTCNDVRGSI